MYIIADLHIHSRFAQACSSDLTVDNLEKWARIKGIDLLGTGDFTHPEWIRELREKLVRQEQGIYYTAGGQAFLLQTEISLIYTQEKGRRIHLLVLAPDFAAVDKITRYLLQHGRVDYDGRPIFKIPAWQFVKDLREISEDIEIIPAHAWTPWFSVFGSKSGFDSLQECFKEQTRHIRAIETGISSDILMNERLSQLDVVRKVSFSDAHSYWPWRLGREATILELQELSYANVLRAIRTGVGFWGTIEADPAYGKYHIDGHRACGVHQEPAVTREKGIMCAVCKQPLTIGVLYRVDQLADRPEAKQTMQREIKLLPLSEIIAMVVGGAVSSKKVWDVYWRLLKTGKNEFDVLLNVPKEQLLSATENTAVVDAILAVREGKINISPAGYDGVYGVPRIHGLQLSAIEEGTQKESSNRAPKSQDAKKEKAGVQGKRTPKSAGQKGLPISEDNNSIHS